jgi:serine/threonine protein kinase
LVLEYVDGGDMLDYIMKYINSNGGGLRESYWYCGIVVLTSSGRTYCCIDAADLQSYGLYSKSAGVPGGRKIADRQHAKGITHRDLKPEVRHFNLDTMNGADPL